MAIEQKLRDFVKETVRGAALITMYPVSSERRHLLTHEERVAKAWNMTGTALNKAVRGYAAKTR